MNSTSASLCIGVLLAGVATLGWALNFIAPYVTGDYSLYDLMAVRFLFAGMLGVGGMLLCRAQRGLVTAVQQWVAAGLGAIGYLGYAACIAAGVHFAGPVLTPTMVAMVPLLLALLGNARHKRVEWRRLIAPLSCLLVGLLLSNLGNTHQASLNAGAWLAGFCCSLGAVGLWLLFSVLNQRYLERLPAQATGLWTALMLMGAGAAVLCLLPLMLSLGLLRLPVVGVGFEHAAPLFAWSLVIALMSTVVGAWAWNAATRRLPMVLSGQLIALESVFASLLGLVFEGRGPTLMEAAGLATVLLGVILAVRIILAGRPGADLPVPVTGQ